jgi:hypothetical protein
MARENNDIWKTTNIYTVNKRVNNGQQSKTSNVFFFCEPFRCVIIR